MNMQDPPKDKGSGDKHRRTRSPYGHAMDRAGMRHHDTAPREHIIPVVRKKSRLHKHTAETGKGVRATETIKSRRDGHERQRIVLRTGHACFERFDEHR